MGKIGKTFPFFLLLILCASCISSFTVAKPISAQDNANPPISVTRTLLWNSSNNLAYSLSITKNIVYLSTQNGTVYALNAENSDVLWSFYAYSGVSSRDIQTISPWAPSISVSADVVYVGSINTVFALNASTGNMIWESPVGSFVHATPVIAAGVVFIGSLDNSVYAFNASNGRELWHCTLGSSFWQLHSTPVVSKGVVYVGSGDYNVYAINATTGVQLWHYNTGIWIDSSAKVANGIVYVNNEAGDYFALNATNGSKLDVDSNTIADILSGTSTVVEQNEVFIGGQLYGRYLYSFNASDYNRLWESSIGVIMSSPVVNDGVVLIAGAAVNGDVLYALNVTNGERLWTSPLWTDQNGGINLSYFSYANGILYVQPYQGNLYAYNISSALPSTPTPIPTSTPTPNQSPINPPHLDPIVYLIAISVIVAAIAVSVLLYLRHRKTNNWQKDRI